MNAATRSESGHAAPRFAWLNLEYTLAGLLALAAIYTGLFDPKHQILVIFAAIYLVGAIGLNILSGYLGIISIAHGALVCVGAYATGIATVNYGVPFWPSALLSVLAGTIVSVILGLPALRLSSWYFVLITVAFALVVPSLLVDFRDITGGYAGVIGIPSPAIPGLDTSQSLFVWVCIVAAILFWVTANISRSRIGAAMTALRDGTVGAAANGVSTAWVRLFAFAISGAIAGIAGAFYAAAKIVITPDEFNFEFSIMFLFIVVLGGPARLTGPIFGVAFYYVLPEFMTALSSYRIVVFGIVLLAFSVFLPSGIAGGLHALDRRRGRVIREPGKRDMRHDVEPVTGMGLTVRNLGKDFGGLTALDGVDLTAEPGSIHVIVGPNGSGKTTLLNIVFGFYPASSGSAELDGVPMLGSSPVRLARMGVMRTFQTPKLLNELSLLDNIRFGAFSREEATIGEVAFHLPRARRERKQITREANQLLALVGLDHLAHIHASELTHGQQRLAEIARALMARPRLILLDEPAAGLSMGELDRLGELLKEVRRLGITLIMVEHHIDLVADVADHVTVLDRGRVLSSGTPEQVFADENVIAAYMGGKT